MDSNVDPENISAITEENDDRSTILDIQVNPLTIMTSMPSFTPVDDNQQNALESINVPELQPQASETVLSLSYNADISSPNIFVSSSNVTDQQTLSNTHMDNRSVAAWVESTTTESISSPLERSPSLPSTVIESIISRSRRNSNVSTVCDQQHSTLSDTLTSQQTSYSNDIQRSLSVPINDQHHHDNNELIVPVNDEEGEDISTKFLPVPDSEDSEVDKKPEKLSSVEKGQVKFYVGPPITQETSKKSSNVSFHASVSFETHNKSLLAHRRRRYSWNTNKNKPSSFQRSNSSMETTQRSSLHAQILRKQFKTALSMPNGAYSYLSDETRQSSSLSDNVFLSTSNTNSSSLQNSSHLIKDTYFHAIPSSGSYISSGRNASIISDASGRSGIESTNLETSISDQIRTLSINNEETINENSILLRQQLHNRTSTTSSGTPSTQSLLSSSDDEMNSFNKKMNDLEIDKDKQKTSTDKRRIVVKQLMWLLDKKTTIYARSGFGYQKSASPTKQYHQKSTPNPFVEVIKQFQFN